MGISVIVSTLCTVQTLPATFNVECLSIIKQNNVTCFVFLFDQRWNVKNGRLMIGSECNV